MKPWKIPFLLILIGSATLSQTIELKIVETSDVHGAIFPYNFTTTKPADGSLARVQTYLNEERSKDQEVILLDNGDILQGTPAVYYYNFERPDEIHLYARVMNYMNYDAGTVGNHDVETGHKVYDKFNSEINFPWLAANAIDTLNNKEYFTPYTMIEKKGIRIAVLGMITPGIPNWLPYKIWEGIEFEDKIEIAKKWVPKILADENPDILVGLFHAGVDYTYGNVNEMTPRNENACKLIAQQVPGFDVIFVGHDHQVWNFEETSSDGSKVLILGPTSGARNVAVANFTLQRDSNSGNWHKIIRGEIVDMKDYQPDEKLLEHFGEEFNEIKKYVSRGIGRLNGILDSRKTLFEDAAFSDLIHNIQLDLTKADVSFTAPLSLSTIMNSGELYVKDMFDLYRYENLLYTMELSGEEIDKFLEHSYALWFNEMTSEEDNLLMFEKDDNGSLKWSERYNTPLLKNRYYNFDTAEGINYTVDASKPAGDKVTITVFTNGSDFDFNSIYKVAVNSYRGNGGGGHLTMGCGIKQEDLPKRVISSTEKDLRYYLMKWIEKTKEVTPTTNNNWKVIPEAWYNTAKEKDYKLLYGKEN